MADCDKIRRMNDVIQADYSCHICLLRHYGKHADEVVQYLFWDVNDETHTIENTLEVYLADKGFLNHE